MGVALVRAPCCASGGGPRRSALPAHRSHSRPARAGGRARPYRGPSCAGCHDRRRPRVGGAVPGRAVPGGSRLSPVHDAVRGAIPHGRRGARPDLSPRPRRSRAADPARACGSSQRRRRPGLLADRPARVRSPQHTMPGESPGRITDARRARRETMRARPGSAGDVPADSPDGVDGPPADAPASPGPVGLQPARGDGEEPEARAPRRRLARSPRCVVRRGSGRSTSPARPVLRGSA